MITANEFLTLKAFQHKFTLTQASVSIEVKRNSEYLFNENGFLIEVYPTRDHERLEVPTLFIWYPEYKAITGYVTGDTVVIGDHTYNIVVGNTFQRSIADIELFTSSPEIDREQRTYTDLCHVVLKKLNASIEVSTDNIDDYTFMSEIKLPIATTPLPLPTLKTFQLTLLDNDQGLFQWKGTNPGDFYYFELWDSWNPSTPLYSQRIGSATGVWNHTFPAIAKGKYNIFTMKIVRNGITYVTREIKVLLPRSSFNLFSRTDGDSHTPRNADYPSLGLRDTQNIYLISRDDSNNLVKSKIAYVWAKVGGQWYTD